VTSVAAPAEPTARRSRRRPRPILGGILPIDRALLPREVAAGVTLAALAIPEVMGYTKIAGTPVVTGLYTLLLPVALFAIFGSSRHLVVGADSATAAILAIGVAGLAATGSAEYTTLASLSALLCAGFLALARLLRLGFIANFLSRSVLVGFLTGVGIQVAAGQVAGMFGVAKGSGGTVGELWGTLQNIAAGQSSLPTLAVAVAVLVVVVGLERVNKAIPGALFAVLGSIVASAALDLQAHGVGVLGTVPGGLPSIGLPTSVMTLDNVTALLPTAISMFVVILAQSAATSRAYAARYNDSFDENVDLVGLGLANLGAAVTGTFVVNGSPTKTEMVDSAGGRSQVAQLTTGVIVLAVLLFLTGPLAYLPNAVLSAVVFLIGLRLVDWRHMVAIARIRRGELAVALATAVTVVLVGVEQGIILAMVLSVVEHVYHSYHPYNTLLTLNDAGRLRYADVEAGAEAAPGLVVYRFGASLYYANATRFIEEAFDLIETADPPLRWLCLAAGGVGDVDYTGADALRQLHGELTRSGGSLLVCDPSPRVRSQLDAYGLTALIGAEHVFEDVHDVVAHCAAEAAG
jgi:high affinity sulfate transporter 1